MDTAGDKHEVEDRVYEKNTVLRQFLLVVTVGGFLTVSGKALEIEEN